MDEDDDWDHRFWDRAVAGERARWHLLRQSRPHRSRGAPMTFGRPACPRG
jgi:hypothetical protein